MSQIQNAAVLEGISQTMLTSGIPVDEIRKIFKNAWNRETQKLCYADKFWLRDLKAKGLTPEQAFPICE